MISLIQALSALDGVSGDEQAVRAFIEEQVAPYCTCKTDPLGNLLCWKKGSKPGEQKLLLSAHMDEVGMIATGVTEDGLLKFTTVGGIDDRVILGREVRFYQAGTIGVIGTKAVHQQSSEERSTPVKASEMFIDIGASSKEEALEAVAIGDRISFTGTCEAFGNGLLKGKALDDRIGCAVLIRLLQSELPRDVMVSFVVQEEVGLRGARAAAYTMDPNCAIVVESTTAADISGVDEMKQVCKLGNGAVVGFMDHSTIYDSELYHLAFSLSKEQNIPCQTKTAVAGGNDSGAIHTSRGGVRTIAVSVPTRYLHSALCVANQGDIEQVYRMVEALVGAID